MATQLGVRSLIEHELKVINNYAKSRGIKINFIGVDRFGEAEFEVTSERHGTASPFSESEIFNQ